MGETRTGRTSLSPALVALFIQISAAHAAPSTASAAPSTANTAELMVEADPACTTEAALIAAIHARSPRLVFVHRDSRATVSARIHATRNGAVGVVTLATEGAPTSTRRVEASNCREATDAVALIIAVSLDPSAQAADSTKPDVAGADPLPTDREPGASGEPAASKPGAPKPETQGADGEASETAGVSRRRAAFSVQLTAVSLLGVAPGVLAGLGAYARVSSEGRSVWAPAFGLGVAHAWRSGISERGGTASFTLDAVSLDACPLRLRSGPIEARPCASLTAGRLSAAGSETLNPASADARPFWNVGGAAVLSAELAPYVELSTRLGVAANLVRDSFLFTPVVFHRVAAVTVAGNVGLGVRWP